MKKIVIVRGGPSSEYDVSLKSGKSVIDELSDIFEITDIVIDKTGAWLHEGLEVKPEHVCRNADCVFNALHGEYGEDGQIQSILERLSVAFTGPRRLGATLSMNKASTKEIYKQHGIKTPLHKVLSRPDTEAGIEVQATLIFQTFPMPIIVKPVGLGSSVGISIARDFKTLVETLKSLYIDHDKVLLEEYISGREATVGVVDKFRDQKIYPFLPIEIRVKSPSGFFDYEAKYSGETEEISPGNFTREENKLMQEIAVKAHDILGLRHYSRTDFIIHPRRGIYVLETNSLPGLTKASLLPKSFEPVGTDYKTFLEHVIGLALEE